MFTFFSLSIAKLIILNILDGNRPSRSMATLNDLLNIAYPLLNDPRSSKRAIKGLCWFHSQNPQNALIFVGNSLLCLLSVPPYKHSYLQQFLALRQHLICCLL